MSTRSKSARLDDVLVERGFFDTRDAAARACYAGDVTSPACACTAPSQAVPLDIELHVRTRSRFVSRGGDKLAGALEDLHVDASGLRCMDAGASTGGFTDCLLQNGAASVCAVDVGYGQFDFSLRGDERVSLFERTNIRAAEVGELGGPFDLLVADLSFISLGSLLPTLKTFVADDGRLLLLVKPQFEAERSAVSRGGVVRSAREHATVLHRVVEAMVDEGLFVEALTPSRIVGRKQGNIEFFVLARNSASNPGVGDSIDIEDIVKRAHNGQGEPA